MNSKHKDTAKDIAVESGVESKVGDLISQCVLDITKYVNTTAGDQVLAVPDNQIRSIIVGFAIAHNERVASDKSQS